MERIAQDMDVNILLFDDFSGMDAFGMAEIFGDAPDIFHVKYLSVTGDIINSHQGVKVWTEFFKPDEIKDVLIIPGGPGIRRIMRDEKFIANLAKAADNASLCLSISLGTVLLAKTGLLFHRNIALHKTEEEWVTSQTGGINWMTDVKWLEDGKFYTASSSIAGIDMAIDFIATQFDINLANKLAKQIGHDWNIYDNHYI
ncbi:MAG: DJ-1/PfpI family protein [Fibrobacter sp.]|nr:DJ-1/PfpI family protein [Fibrobacter sp.]